MRRRSIQPPPRAATTSTDSAQSSLSAAAPSFTPNEGQIPKKPCPRCKLPGHWARDSPNASPTDECFRCHRNGHIARECPFKRHRPGTGAKCRSYHSPQPVKARPQAPVSTQATYIRARIEGRVRHCLPDSGADVSLILASFVKTTEVEPVEDPVLAANSTPIHINGSVTLPVTVDHNRFYSTLLVSPNIGEVNLGRDWLAKHKVTWQFGNIV